MLALRYETNQIYTDEKTSYIFYQCQSNFGEAKCTVSRSVKMIQISRYIISNQGNVQDGCQKNYKAPTDYTQIIGAQVEVVGELCCCKGNACNLSGS